MFNNLHLSENTNFLRRLGAVAKRTALRICKLLSFENYLVAPSILRAFFLLCLFAWTVCEAKAVTLNYTDINVSTTGSGGTSGPPNVYTVTSAGSGIGASGPTISPATDSFGYYWMQNTGDGNTEIITQITGDNSTNAYAVSGIMVRDSLSANAAQVTIGVSPQNGCNFIQRLLDGGQATSTIGPSVSPATFPWIRIVVSGTTGNVAGYESPDGENWQLVGSCTLSLPTNYYIGLAVSSNAPSSALASQFSNLSYMTNVPQKSSNLALWLRSDVGVVQTGNTTPVTTWTDQSGNGLNATNASNNPTFVDAAHSTTTHLPYVAFNGTNQVLEIGPSFSNLTQGFSIIIVYNPTYVANARIIDTGTGGTANNNVVLSEHSSVTTSNVLTVYNGTVVTPSTGIVGTNSITSGFQFLEVFQDPVGNVSMWTNATQDSLTSIAPFTTYNNPVPVVTRTNTAIGASANQPTATNFFSGSISEILVFSKKLSEVERVSVENYVKSKFSLTSILPQSTLGAPVIANPSGFYTTPQQITITANPGSQIWYTENGADPVAGSSTLYSAPFTVSGSETIKAICTQFGYITSSYASAAIAFDPTTLQVPTSNLLCWYRSDQGVIRSGGGISVNRWLDLSKMGNHASQTVTGNQPTLVNSLFSGQPGVNFLAANSQFMYINGNFNNFASGLSMLVVCTPGNNVGQTIVGLGNGNGTNTYAAQLYIGNPVSYQFLEGPYTVSIGPFYNQPQLIEAIQGTNVGTIFVNGATALAGTVNNPSDAARTFNYIGQTTPGIGTVFLNSAVAELLIYNSTLTALQRTTLQSYLMQRYGIAPSWAAAPVPTPTFSVAAPATFAAPTNVSILGPAGATLYITQDGTTPTTSSPVYTQPVNVTYTQTIKALAVLNGISSTVLTGTYAVAAAAGDTHEFPAPASTDVTTPHVNISLPTTGAP